MSAETPSARELTRRLVAREAARDSSPDGAAVAVHAAGERAYRVLSRWLGSTGADVLFARALAQARIEHPALSGIRLRVQPEPGVEGVRESIAIHGADAVAAGLEALLVALLQLLGRLVGEDMATRLVEQSVPNRAPDDPRPQ